MKALIAYDGTLHSKTALRYGIEKVKEEGGSAIVLHVFNSAMFVDYGAGPSAEAIARAESKRYLEEARGIIREAGEIMVRLLEKEGNPEEEILQCAVEESADIIFSPPKYASVRKTAPCPVSIVPGNILVPLDTAETSPAALERIVSEARAAASKVIVLGIIPIHIYGREEREALEKVKKETSAAVKALKNRLREHGIEAKEAVLSGYPDEEILKAAEKYEVSMIVVPEEGSTPSEISKAASMITDEPEGFKIPLMKASEK